MGLLFMKLHVRSSNALIRIGFVVGVIVGFVVCWNLCWNDCWNDCWNGYWLNIGSIRPGIIGGMLVRLISGFCWRIDIFLIFVYFVNIY